MRLKYLLLGGLAVSALSLAPLAKAQTLWTNTSIPFMQFSPDPSVTDDFLTSEVSMTRGGNGVLFNDSTSNPDTVLFAFGSIQNYAALSYSSMEAIRDAHRPDLADVILNVNMVMQLQNEQIYIPVMFTAWGRGGAGGWTYSRGTAPAAPILTPVKLFSPTISGSSIVFSYSNATPGLTYVVQSSSNLTSWIPVSTNVATGSTTNFTNAVSAGAKYFRVQTLSGQ